LLTFIYLILCYQLFRDHYFYYLHNLFTLSAKYIHYLFTASNGKGHGIHSPFVFDLVSNVLNDHRKPEAFHKIENLRKSLLKNNERIVVEDFGAGSSLDSSTERRISDIARHAAKPSKFGCLLYRLAEHYNCQEILELGTSLGLSTAYMASPPSVVHITTLEGAAFVAARAKQNLESLSISKVEIITGNFDITLEQTLKKNPKPDLVFFDGNHRKEPTLRYFRQCLSTADENSIFVFDDIHWSTEMEEAWLEICQSEVVTCSIDLFFVGIVFFRKDFREKQAFTIRY
jgi:predicted O-methyltransferase YrrM